MSVDLRVYALVIGTAVLWTVISTIRQITGTGISAVNVKIAALLGGVSIVLIWVYSPLPAHNGGWGAPKAKLQKWGWTSEPQEGYGDDNAGERTTAAFPQLVPVRLADKGGDDGD